MAVGGWRVLATLPLAALMLAGCSGSGSYIYDWSIFVDAVVRPDGLILTGVWLTLIISVVAQMIGVLLGVFSALGRTARL